MPETSVYTVDITPIVDTLSFIYQTNVVIIVILAFIAGILLLTSFGGGLNG